MSVKTIITIGRQTGCGGREIGKRIAEQLQIPYYDKELIDRAAENSEFSKEFFKTHDEKRASSFLYSLAMESPSHGFAGALSGLPLDHKVFLAQFNTIKEIAQEGGCVIVGRCADYALEDNPHLLSLFLHADLEFRTERVAEELSISKNEARALINKTDKSRASYYSYYSGRKWGVASNYHISIDSSKFGVEETVRIISSIAQIKSDMEE